MWGICARQQQSELVSCASETRKRDCVWRNIIKVHCDWNYANTLCCFARGGYGKLVHISVEGWISSNHSFSNASQWVVVSRKKSHTACTYDGKSKWVQNRVATLWVGKYHRRKGTAIVSGKVFTGATESRNLGPLYLFCSFLKNVSGMKWCECLLDLHATENWREKT